MSYSPHPHYPYPPHLLFVPVLRVLIGLHSRPSQDAATLLAHVRPQPRVHNAQNIPPDSPFVLVFNHYDRPGLGAWWGPVVLAHSIAKARRHAPREIHYVMVREWWYPGGWGRAFKQPLTNWFFGRLARAYGFLRVPPVLDARDFRGEGATSVRAALRLTRGKQPQLVGLAPEGRTGPSQSLCVPPPGTGLFLLMLTHGTVPCLPAGIYEEDDCALAVNFGRPFSLFVAGELERPARDCAAARRVMVEISRLLPERMRGMFAEEARN